MIDKETMDEVIRLNDFLDSVFGIAKKIVVVGAVIGVAALATILPIWPLVSQNPTGFVVTGFLLLVAGGLAGAAITLLATRGKTKRQIEARDSIIAGQEEVIAGLEKRPTQEKFEEKRKECEGLRGGITALKKRDSDLAAFRMKFKGLGPEDMEWVVRVYRAGRQGLEPSDAELTLFNDGVDIKKFLRLDAAGQRLFLVDGVEGMLDRCGDLVSYAMRVVCEQDVARAEARAMAAEAKLSEHDAEASKLAEDNRILHMDYLTKGLLYAIATGEEFKTRDDDPSYLSRNAKNFEAFQNLLQMGLANYETCGMHELRWFGTELAAKLVEEHSDLFGKAKEEVEEIRSKEGTV